VTQEVNRECSQGACLSLLELGDDLGDGDADLRVLLGGGLHLLTGADKGGVQRELSVRSSVAGNQVPDHDTYQLLPLLGLSLGDGGWHLTQLPHHGVHRLQHVSGPAWGLRDLLDGI
jgi:hypothetical protein